MRHWEDSHIFASSNSIKITAGTTVEYINPTHIYSTWRFSVYHDFPVQEDCGIILPKKKPNAACTAHACWLGRASRELIFVFWLDVTRWRLGFRRWKRAELVSLGLHGSLHIYTLSQPTYKILISSHPLLSPVSFTMWSFGKGSEIFRENSPLFDFHLKAYYMYSYRKIIHLKCA